MSLKERVGESVGPFEKQILIEDVRKFNLSLGRTDLNSVAPTYLTTLRETEMLLIDALGFQFNGIIHGEQEYHYGEKIEPGDVILVETQLKDAMEKRTGKNPMAFLVFKSEFTKKSSQKMVGQSRTVLIVRF